MIGQTVSHYKILEKLGEGGMGVVYKAHDAELDRDVALKFLPHHIVAGEAEQARFLQEARAAALLNHPHICTIYAIERCGDDQFIAMELVEGKTLRKKIENGGLRIEDGIGYAIQIAEALQEAHCHGIVHRDVKADNIMVNSKNQVKVMDFGLAKLKGSLHLTKTSSTVGTLAYMAPEQIEGGEVDARSDIFSFGIVLYEMLTGHLPFRGEHEAAMVYSIVNEDPEPLQTYVPSPSPELLHVLQRALAKDREERYQSVHDMLIDLRLVKKDSTRVSRPGHQPKSTLDVEPPTPFPQTAKRGAKWYWWAAAVFVALSAVAVVVVVLNKPHVRLNPNKTAVALHLPFDDVEYPSISKDGRWIAFPARGKSGGCEVYLMNIAGEKATQVTNEQAPRLLVCDISPDLSQIAYVRSEGSRGVVPTAAVHRIKVVNWHGGDGRTLADTGSNPHWTPDGTRIGYLRIGADFVMPAVSGKFEVWSVKPDGTDRRLEFIDTNYVRTDPRSFSWSPDGKSIAWVRNFPGQYGEVMVRNLASGEERQLTSDRKYIDEVEWAANDMIIFSSNKSGQSNLWMIPSGGGEAIQITSGTVPISTARISGDTRKILLAQIEHLGQLWISSSDGGSFRQLTSDDVCFTVAQFSPDGSSIAAVIGDVDEGNRENQLYVMDRQANNRRAISPRSQVVSRCNWSPDGKWLAFVSAPINEPISSSKVFLVDPSNPSSPKLVSQGDVIRWIDSEHLAIWRNMKSWIYATAAGEPRQLYRDSTRVYAQKGADQILFQDFHKGRQGWWIGSLDAEGKDRREPKRVLGLDHGIMTLGRQFLSFSSDMKFLVYAKRDERGNSIWKLRLSDGMEERICTTPFYDMGFMGPTPDGKEMLWIKLSFRTKIGMIENPFE